MVGVYHAPKDLRDVGPELKRKVNLGMSVERRRQTACRSTTLHADTVPTLPTLPNSQWIRD